MHKIFTIEKFVKEKDKHKMAIICKTENEAKLLCKELDKQGLCWSTGVSYVGNTRWSLFSPQTRARFYTNNNKIGIIGNGDMEGLDYCFFTETRMKNRISNIFK